MGWFNDLPLKLGGKRKTNKRISELKITSDAPCTASTVAKIVCLPVHTEVCVHVCVCVHGPQLQVIECNLQQEDP